VAWCGEWYYPLLQAKDEEVAEDNHEKIRGKMTGATRHFEIEHVAFYMCGFSLASSVETAGAPCR
jgi:hypothetical protein